MRTPSMNPELIHRRRWAILAVLCLSIFLVVVDNTIVNVALPTIATELGASTSDLQWIVDAYALVFSCLLLAAGGIGDRWGRKGALQVGLLLFGATSLLAALSGTTGQLIAARGAMGVGAALAFPATLAILSSTFTNPAERAKAIGIWSGVVGIAVAAGPITGGALLEHFWWGSVFFVNVPIVAISLVAGRAVVPSSCDTDAGPLDRLGLLLSSAAVGVLVFTVIDAPQAGWSSARTLGGLVVAATLGVLFARHELRVADPLLDIRVFRDRRFSTASASVTLAAFALVGMIFLMTQYLQFVRGHDALGAGVRTLPFAVAIVVAAPVSARTALRHGARPVVTIGLVLIAVGLLMTAALHASSGYWTSVVPAMAILAGGVSSVFTPATDVIMSSLPPAKAGVGSAVNDTTREIGGTLGVAIVGSIFASVYSGRVADELAPLDLPDGAVRAAEESAGAASAVADELGGSSGDAIRDAANTAFIAGISTGLLVAAAVSTAGAVIAWTMLPRVAREAERHDAEAKREVVEVAP